MAKILIILTNEPCACNMSHIYAKHDKYKFYQYFKLHSKISLYQVYVGTNAL